LEASNTSGTSCPATQQHSPEDLTSLLFMNLAFVIKVKITVAALSSFEALGSVQI